MYSKCTVIACNSGGPLESIVDGVTGFLLPPEPTVWQKKLDEIIRNKISTGEAGRKRAKELFSFEAFTDRLIQCIDGQPSQTKKE
jgi:alpha-1,3/alpha-1,6-mannosyltransferase